MKKLLGVIVLLLLVAAGGIWYFTAFHLDNMVRDRIQQVATRSLGTAVTVGSVTTDIKGGSMTIGDITIANPPGFRNPNALTLRGIEAAIDYATLEVRHLVIEKPEIVIEEVDGETNVQRLLAAIERDPAPEPPGQAEEPVTIVIHHFRMNASRAAFESASLEHYSDVKIDAVELSNLRGTPMDVGRRIGREVLEEAVEAAAIELLKAKAAEKLGELFNRD